MTAAAVRTASLKRDFHLSESQAEDVRQSIILGLLEREPAFDSDKGSVNTFTGAVSANLAADIANALSKEWERVEYQPDFRDAENDPSYLGLPHPHHLGKNVVPLWADDRDLFRDSETLHDIQAALACMSQEQQDLFNLIDKHHDISSAAKAAGMPTATFYRRIDDLRMHLRMFGIRPAA
jgi:DNA-directed RNA polymerase specialized sigma24 family protein